MPADFPYERDVDREALEKRRAEQLRVQRKVAVRKELQAAERDAHPPGSPPRTQEARVRLTLREERMLDEAARDLGVSRANLLRRAALAMAIRIRGPR